MTEIAASAHPGAMNPQDYRAGEPLPPTPECEPGVYCPFTDNGAYHGVCLWHEGPERTCTCDGRTAHSTRPPEPDTAACEWCGRAVAQNAEGRWYAVKGEERGYDPLTCDVAGDGRHDAADREFRDYAGEIIAQGKAAPEDQALYNVIRASLDYWWNFTTAEFILRDKGPDAYRDGLTRRLLCDLRIARERGQVT